MAFCSTETHARRFDYRVVILRKAHALDGIQRATDTIARITFS